ncbi:properdin-like [Asterias amurensis]|uniref:properdin-like n=1 Tax=Asterias amurensis TaxID=7602 RepID=UPI003AB7C133
MKTRGREMMSCRAQKAVLLAVACFAICSIAVAGNEEGFCFRHRTPIGKRGKCHGLVEIPPGSGAQMSTAAECCDRGGTGLAERITGKKCRDACDGEANGQEQMAEEDEDSARVGGVLGEWGEWTPCSVSCGEGTMQRQRECICMSPGNKTCCNGQNVEEKLCNTNVLCPVNGQWGEWSQWSECSATCGEAMSRSRECDSPLPQHGGDNCTGDYMDVAWCNNKRKCPIDGGWKKWSAWSPCSATCGRKGRQNRYRSCTDPKPDFGGLDCQGDVNSQRTCTSNRRCPIDGGWGDWKEWHCPEECSQGMEGTAWRNRFCTNPFPLHGGKTCIGSSVQREPCPSATCPVNGGWGEWSSWSKCSSTCGTNGFKTRKRQCDNPLPTFGGYPCDGDPIGNKSCDNDPCLYNPEDDSQGSAVKSEVPCDDEDFDSADGGSGCNGSGDGSSIDEPEYKDYPY